MQPLLAMRQWCSRCVEPAQRAQELGRRAPSALGAAVQYSTATAHSSPVSFSPTAHIANTTTTATMAKSAKSFASGQLVSLCSMASFVMAKLLVQRDVSAPAFVNCCFYITLAIVCLTYAWRQQSKQQLEQSATAAGAPETPLGSPVLSPLGMSPTTDCELADPVAIKTMQQQTQLDELRWWFYLIVAFFDLQANCLAVRSLAFTDYVSAGLMLNLTIPFVSLLSCVAYERKYSWPHITGCCLATVGGVVLFVGSYLRDANDESSQQTYGCLLALLAAFMYGASNITNQLYLCVQTVDRMIESLGMVAAFGSGLAMVQMLLLERDQVTAIVWSSDVSPCIAAYIGAMFAFYLLASLLPQTLSSPLYNLSILASNLYLPFASYYFFAEKPSDYFFVALLLVLVGLTMHCVEHSRASQQQRKAQQQFEQLPDVSNSTALLKPRVCFSGSMHTPTDVTLVAIQIEQAAL